MAALVAIAAMFVGLYRVGSELVRCRRQVEVFQSQLAACRDSLALERFGNDVSWYDQPRWVKVRCGKFTYRFDISSVSKEDRISFARVLIFSRGRISESVSTYISPVDSVWVLTPK